jgi:hypothetical protein
MSWIAQKENEADADTLGNRLWAATGPRRANSDLTSQQRREPSLCTRDGRSSLNTCN